MTIHEARQQLRFQLFHLYDEREADNITDLVMEHITGWQRIDRIINETVPLSAPQQQQLQLYTKALLESKPLQYVLNEAWFYGMKLYVDENVLIPRPETEELADWLIKTVKRSGLPVHHSLALPVGKKIIDIGTGSGCIPLAIKKSLPAVEIHACDISVGALEVAKRNAADLQLNIHFHLLDILSAAARSQLPIFDIIISNPPYIPLHNKVSMAANVLRYEPHTALFTEDNDPLLFYTAIADFAKSHLHKNGSIYLEIHEEMGEAIVNLYNQKGFSNIELKKDLQGKDRMVRAEVDRET